MRVNAAIARSASPGDAVVHLRAGLGRQRNGGTVQSVANTIRNAVVILDRSDRAERAVPLIGWLEVNRPSIPGTPGMRDHPATLGHGLRRRLGDAAYETERVRGADATTAEVIDLALEALTGLTESAELPDTAVPTDAAEPTEEVEPAQVEPGPRFGVVSGA